MHMEMQKDKKIQGILGEQYGGKICSTSKFYNTKLNN